MATLINRYIARMFLQADLRLVCSHSQKDVASKQVKSDHLRPASETPSELRFAGGPLVVHDGMLAGYIPIQ